MSNAVVFFPNTSGQVSVATAGALTGDGTSGNKLAVAVDGTTVEVNGSNQVHAFSVIKNAGNLLVNTTTSGDINFRAFDNVAIFGGSNTDGTPSAEGGGIDIEAKNGIATVSSISMDTLGRCEIDCDDNYTVASGGVIALNPFDHVSVDGDLTSTGVIKGGGYQSSDGSAGMTTSTTVAGIGVKTITIKNGLITSIA